MIYASGREIAMTPTGAVTWELIDHADGRLYMPGQDRVQDNRVAGILTSGVTGEPLNPGEGPGSAYAPAEHPDLVVKEFASHTEDARFGGLPTLRANVMLATGLEMVRQRHAWRMQGGQVLGAYVLADPEKRDNGRLLRARWVMAKAQPVPGVDTADYMTWRNRHPARGGLITMPATKQPELPTPEARSRLYYEALEVVSGGLKAVDHLVANFDDHPGNVIIEKLPVQNAPSRFTRRSRTLEQGQATKLDSIAIAGFDF